MCGCVTAAADGAIMRILGLDPGLQVTGYGCIDCPPGQRPRLCEAGVVRLPRSTSVADRIARLYDDVQEVFRELQPDVVAVEQLFTHARHTRTAMLMGHARGVLLLLAVQHRCRLTEHAPASIKLAVAGHGRATKAQMQHAVMMECGLPAPPEPHDGADAIAVALCAGRRLEPTPATA